MEKNPSVLDYIFFFSIIIIIVIFIIFRYSIFKQFNYGEYIKEESSICITETGKCNITGYTTIIERCQRNQETGRGCIENNKQTFLSKITKVGCLSQCKSSIFSLNNLTPCIIPNYDQPCISENEKDKILGERQKIMKCIPWDAYGVNNCIYTTSSNSQIDIPITCKKNDYTITCDIDTVHVVNERCNDPVFLSENGEYKSYEVCSERGINEDGFIGLCENFTPSSSISSSCRDMDGKIYDEDIYTLHSGVMYFNEVCLGKVCKNEEKICIKPCLYFPEKITLWNEEINFLLTRLNSIMINDEYLIDKNTFFIFRPAGEFVNPSTIFINILYLNNKDRGYLYINDKNEVKMKSMNFDDTHIDEINDKNAIFSFSNEGEKFILNLNNISIIDKGPLSLQEINIKLKYA
jgi:hypothetical protein